MASHLSARKWCSEFQYSRYTDWASTTASSPGVIWRCWGGRKACAGGFFLAMLWFVGNFFKKIRNIRIQEESTLNTLDKTLYNQLLKAVRRFVRVPTSILQTCILAIKAPMLDTSISGDLHTDLNVPAIVEMEIFPATVEAFSCHQSEPAQYTGKQFQCMEFLGRTIFLPQSSRTTPHKMNTRFIETHKSSYIDIMFVELVVVVVVAAVAAAAAVVVALLLVIILLILLFFLLILSFSCSSYSLYYSCLSIVGCCFTCVLSTLLGVYAGLLLVVGAVVCCCCCCCCCCWWCCCCCCCC